MKKILQDGGIDDESSDDGVSNASSKKGLREQNIKKIINKMEKLAEEGVIEEEGGEESSDDSVVTATGGKKKSVKGDVDTRDEYKNFIKSLKAWLLAENELEDLREQKNEISKKIKKIEDTKEPHEIVVSQFLDEPDQGGSVQVSDGSTIAIVRKTKMESYSLKTIPKYMAEVFAAINKKDLEFIKDSIIPLRDDKNCPDIKWSKLPQEPEEYYNLLNKDPKLLANIAALYASVARQSEEETKVKRTGAKKTGDAKAIGKAPK